MTFGRYIQVSFDSVRYRKRTDEEYFSAMEDKENTSFEINSRVADKVSIMDTINADEMFYAGFETLKLPYELRTTIEVKSDGNGISGRIRIRNLAQSSIDFLTTLSAKGYTHELYVVVDAGYKSGNMHGEIIRASVASVNIFREGEDSVTEVILKDYAVNLAYRKVMISQNFAGSELSILDIIKNQLDMAGVPYVDEISPYMKVRPLPPTAMIKESITFYDTIYEFLSNYLPLITYQKPIPFQYQNHNKLFQEQFAKLDPVLTMATFYVDMRGLLHLCWEDLSSKDSPVLISAETGLLEMPRQSSKTDKDELKVKHILLPHFHKGGRVNLKSIDEAKNGVYKIGKMKIKGDNYSGDHYVTMTLEKDVQ